MIKKLLFIGLFVLISTQCFAVIIDGYDSVTANRKVVAVAGTAEQFTAVSTPCSVVVVSGMSTNTGVVVIGNTGVVADEATRTGIPLLPFQSEVFYPDNLSDLYINSEITGEGVTYVYYS